MYDESLFLFVNRLYYLKLILSCGDGSTYSNKHIPPPIHSLHSNRDIRTKIHLFSNTRVCTPTNLVGFFLNVTEDVRQPSLILSVDVRDESRETSELGAWKTLTERTCKCICICVHVYVWACVCVSVCTCVCTCASTHLWKKYETISLFLRSHYKINEPINEFVYVKKNHVNIYVCVSIWIASERFCI